MTGMFSTRLATAYALRLTRSPAAPTGSLGAHKPLSDQRMVTERERQIVLQMLDFVHQQDLVRHVMENLPTKPYAEEKSERPSWMVNVRYDAPTHDRQDRFTTVGVLVGPRHVLTCGHLFEDALMRDLPDEPRVAQRKFFVRVGTTVLGTGEYRKVARFRTAGFVPVGSPGVGDAVEVNDLAMLFLDAEVTNTPIRIADKPATLGDTVSFFGWPDGDNGTRELTQVTTTVIDPKACATGFRGEDEFCAANVAGDRQLRAGFAGGPVIRIPEGGTIDDAELVGLSSRGADGLGDDIPPPGIVVDIAGRHRQFVLDCLAETV